MIPRTPLPSPVDLAPELVRAAGGTEDVMFVPRASGNAPAPISDQDRISLLVRALGDAALRADPRLRHLLADRPPLDLGALMKGTLVTLARDGTPLGRVANVAVQGRDLKGGARRTRIVIDVDREPPNPAEEAQA